MSLPVILGILLAISVAGNALLSKLYVGAKQDVARVQQAYDSFVAQAKVIGEKQEKETAARIAADKENKEKSDAANAKDKRTLTGLYDAYRSLRDQRAKSADSSLLPPTAPGATSPATATFDRSALDRGMATADGVLQEGALRILQRGDTAIVDLETARKWAQGR